MTPPIPDDLGSSLSFALAGLLARTCNPEEIKDQLAAISHWWPRDPTSIRELRASIRNAVSADLNDLDAAKSDSKVQQALQALEHIRSTTRGIPHQLLSPASAFISAFRTVRRNRCLQGMKCDGNFNKQVCTLWHEDVRHAAVPFVVVDNASGFLLDCHVFRLPIGLLPTVQYFAQQIPHSSVWTSGVAHRCKCMALGALAARDSIWLVLLEDVPEGLHGCEPIDGCSFELAALLGMLAIRFEWPIPETVAAGGTLDDTGKAVALSEQDLQTVTNKLAIARLSGYERLVYAVKPPSTTTDGYDELVGNGVVPVESLEKLEEYVRGSTRRPSIVVGLPSGRRIGVSCPEPYTTRRESIERVSQKLKSILDERVGHLVVVEGTPGWGKSDFISLCLADMHCPIHMADLDGVQNSRQIARVLLGRELRLSDHAQAEIDEVPYSSVDYLTESLGGPAIVFFENTQCNRDGQVAPSLTSFIRKLVQSGHVVILECWSHDSRISEYIRGNQLSTLSRTELPPLSADETFVWALAETGRSIVADEAASLEYLAGHPLRTKRALRLLADKYPFPEPDDYAVDILELSDVWSDVDQMFVQHLGTARSSSSGSYPISDLLCSLIAVWPWASVDETFLASLDQQARREFSRLEQLGIAWRDVPSNTWKVGAWGRILATQRLIKSPEIIDVASDTITGAAEYVPVNDVESSRRHLVALASLVRTQSEFLLGCIQKLPSAIDPKLGDNRLQKTPYEAPATSEVVASGIIPEDVDLQLWLLLSAARNHQSESVERLLVAVLNRAEEDKNVRRHLWHDWKSVKSVHAALTSLPNLKVKLQLCDRAIAMVCDGGDDTTNQAVVAWRARLYAYASAVAQRSGVLNSSAAWGRRAAEAIGRLAVSERASYQRYFRDDTAYRISLLLGQGDAGYEPLAVVHQRALDAIPAEPDWDPDRLDLWRHRILHHTRFILRSTVEPSRDRLARLRAVFRERKTSIYWFWDFGKYWRERTYFAESVVDLLRSAVQDKAATLRNDPHADSRLRAIARIYVEGLDANRLLDLLGKYAAIGSTEVEFEDIELLLLCFQYIGDHEEVVGGERGRVLEACNRLLRSLLGENTTVEPGSTRLLRRTCLNHFTRHVLRFEEDGPQFSYRFAQATRKIDGVYRAQAGASGDPLIWWDWAEARIRLVSRRSAKNLTRQEREEAELESSSYLRDLVRSCFEVWPHDLMSAQVAVRIYRYLWDYEAAAKHLNSLIEATTEGDTRFRVLELGIGVLAPCVLEPPLTRHHKLERVGERDSTALFCALLHERMTNSSRERERRWIQSILEVLTNSGRSQAWEKLSDQADLVLGPPGEYWARLVEVANSSDAESPDPGDPNGPHLLRDLTDASMLSLAGRLFRYAAGSSELSPELQARTAQHAVASATSVALWYRSWDRVTPSAKWNVAISIAIALGASSDGRIFGSRDSHVQDRQGTRFLTWTELSEKLMNDVGSIAFGAFRLHARVVAATLRESLALHHHAGAVS